MSSLNKDDYRRLSEIIGTTDAATLKRLRRHIDSPDEGPTTPLSQVNIRELSPFINSTDALLHLNRALKGRKSRSKIPLAQVDERLRESVDIEMSPHGDLGKLTYFARPADSGILTIYRELTPVYEPSGRGILAIHVEDLLTGEKSQMGPKNESKNTGDWFASVFQRTQEAIAPSDKNGK